jgi:peptidoglycan/LPS O-acetylase OafA/YrhL
MRRQRLALLDAVRGAAACWVAAAHIFTNSQLHPIFVSRVPVWLAAFFEEGGHLGVAVFFVLSGFVIAYSILPYRVTGRFVLEFGARRSLRLDPPYWVTLGLVVGLNALSNRILVDRVAAVPSAAVFAMNMAYLQGVITIPAILGVSWTLCLEVQFYLTFALGLCLVTRVARPSAHVELLSLLVFAPVVWLSLRFGVLQYFYAFLIGALACWSGRKAIPASAAACGIVAIGWIGMRGHNPDALMIAATAFGIQLADRQGWLTWSGGRVLQGLGALSYSFYLVHTVVSGPVEDLGYRLTRASFPGAVAWACLAFGGSLIAATLLSRFVERPGIALAARLRGWHDRTMKPLAVG